MCLKEKGLFLVILLVSFDCFINAAYTYHPDSQFSMCALSKLEGLTNIKAFSSLVEVKSKLVTAAGLTLEPKAELKIANLEDTRLHVEIILAQWTAGRSLRPPTWRSLIEVLCEVGLSNLGQELEDFMSGIVIIHAWEYSVHRLHEGVQRSE